MRITDSSHPHWRYPNLLKHIKPQYPDHVWVTDITSIRLGWRFIGILKQEHVDFTEIRGFR